MARHNSHAVYGDGTVQWVGSEARCVDWLNRAFEAGDCGADWYVAAYYPTTRTDQQRLDSWPVDYR